MRSLEKCEAEAVTEYIERTEGGPREETPPVRGETEREEARPRSVVGGEEASQKQRCPSSSVGHAPLTGRLRFFSSVEASESSVCGPGFVRPTLVVVGPARWCCRYAARFGGWRGQQATSSLSDFHVSNVTIRWHAWAASNLLVR